MKIISLFSGCGGLDLGFKKAGFEIIWANDNSKSVWKTYENNFPETFLCKKNLTKINASELPSDIIGIIGGPPCQSWSIAGNGKGINDPRGALFYDFIRILRAKRPAFFLLENVEGILSKRNQLAFEKIRHLLSSAGYFLSYEVMTASHYSVPQNRKRLFMVGYRKDLNIQFTFPKASQKTPIVKDAIWDLRLNAIPASILKGNKANGDKCLIPNHEYWLGSYSYIFMSRQRVLSWDKPSFTIQASGRHVPIHPSAPKMIKAKKDVMKFVQNDKKKYRRLSIRECARIQSFPDNFIFYYDTLQAGYQMIGNAVPVNLAYTLAKKIYFDLNLLLGKQKINDCASYLFNGKKLCELNTDLKPLKIVRF